MGEADTEPCESIIGYSEMRLDDTIEQLKKLAEEIDSMLQFLLEMKQLIKELDVPELMEQTKVKA